MKLHYSKILLFSLSLIILAHNKNKPYITPHTPTPTSRVLIECNIYMPNYDYDPDMKYVKENFDRQTSQRFEKFNKRMITKRKKYKDQRDKDIEQIILKDKIKKSFAERVEKGCLKCACGLGGVATSVGVLGTAVVNVLRKGAMAAAVETAIAGGEAEGAAKGAADVIAGLEALNIDKLFTKTLGSFISGTNYNEAKLITGIVNMRYNMTCKPFASGGFSKPSNTICDTMEGWRLFEGSRYVDVQMQTVIGEKVNNVVTVAETAAEKTAENVTAAGIQSNIAEVKATYAICQNAIIASTVAILVIVLVMVIIYLILRYRRKKKMNKKLQYTKLLN
ncbi:rifin [Plasmodium sp. gorilla clade G1]|nr:rifin [Plasmodium sp. gorilla clade G1]